MPGTVRYIGARPNEISWPLNEAARVFEDLVAEYVKLHVATADGSIRCEQTRAAHDEGCDILITARSPFHLLGHDIELPPGKTTMRVYVEVKTSSQNRLDGNFLVDYTQAVGRMPDVYVLATNATITPYYQYIAEANWAHHGARFVLSDRWLLARSLTEAGMAERCASRGVELPDEAAFPKRPRDISIEYQVSTPPTGPSDRLDVYLAIRNLTRESRRARLNLRSERAWVSETTAPEIDVVLPPSGCRAIKLDYQLTGFNTYSPLQVRVTSEHRTDSILIQRENLHLSLVPPFTGKTHRKIREQLQDTFAQERANRVISIAGAAGVGKSRILTEALEQFHTTRYFVSTFYFSRGKNDRALLDFFSGLHYEDPSPGDGADVDGSLERFLEHCASSECSIEHSILIFEDLHHASARAIRLIRELIDSANLQRRDLYVVITGRNDHTFPNEEYFSLLSYVGYASRFTAGRASAVLAFEVGPLSDQDAGTLVRSMMKDAPPQAIQRILKLGESNPWVLVEVIQHLLDRGIAHLLSRRTVSIIAPELLHRADAIPPDVLNLQLRRFAGLKDAGEAGMLGRRLLLAASFFGFEIDSDLLSVLSQSNEGREAWNLLLERRFVVENDEKRTTFAHENFLHFIRDWVRAPSNLEHRAEACETIAGREDVISRLTLHDRGEFYWLHGEARAAWPYFSDIWRRATSMTTVSSEEIDKSFFPYLETVFHLAVKLGEPPAQLVKICQAMAYMGVHNFPLPQGIAACDRALALIEEQRLSDIARLSIRQVRAHGLLNMGQSSSAFRQFLEVEADLQEVDNPDLSIAFDLYDRLQEYYRKINHRRLSDKYGRLARLTLDAGPPDVRLEAAHLITVSVVRLYDSKPLALQAAKDAFAAAQRTDIQRFKIYTRLTELIASALHAKRPSDLHIIYEEAVMLLEKAQRDNLSDSIMRCELLLATLSLFVFEEEERAKALAIDYAHRGLNDSARFGNGLFDWAFHNLLGVIFSPSSGSDDIAHSMTERGRRHFASCFETLRSRGLTFLGACDGCYPNIYAISNILRAYLVFGDRVPRELLSHIGVYDDALLARSRVSGVFSAVRAGKLLLTPNSSTFDQVPQSRSAGAYILKLRYPRDGGYFTPVF